MSKEDVLYLNISSGTPAMKSGLLVLKTLGEFQCIAIQVATPARRMNEHTHKENDILEESDSEIRLRRCSYGRRIYAFGGDKVLY